MSLSFPVCQLLLWMAPIHFHFRVVLWFGLFLRLHQALSLVDGFTHDKSVPTCFRHFKQDLNSKLKFLSSC